MPSKITHIYVIATRGGLLKLGRAVSPTGRLSSIQTHSPLPIHLVHSEPVPIAIGTAVEREAHHSLRATLSRGEWFKTDAATAIDAIKRAVIAVNAPSYKQKPVIRTTLRRKKNYSGDQSKGARAQWWRENILAMSRPVFARLIGASVSTVERYETNRVHESNWTYYRLACAAVDADLIGWEWPKTP